MGRVSVRPSHRNPEDLQPEVCELCGGLIGHVHLLETDVEGLRGYKVCDRHSFEATARVTPSLQDYQRYGPGPFATDEARLEPIGGPFWWEGEVEE